MLNIKDPETNDLAHRVAKKTGETLTKAVNVALRERLDRLDERDQTKKRVAAILEIGRRGAKMFPSDWSKSLLPCFLFRGVLKKITITLKISSGRLG